MFQKNQMMSEPKVPSQSDKDKATELYEEFEELFYEDHLNKALDCIERAIQLVHNNEEYWMQKGLCLQWLSREEDAIESFNKSISIKPTSDAYISQAQTLYELKRLKEAINCLEEGLRQLPKDRELISYLNSYKSKLNK